MNPIPLDITICAFLGSFVGSFVYDMLRLWHRRRWRLATWCARHRSHWPCAPNSFPGHPMSTDIERRLAEAIDESGLVPGPRMTRLVRAAAAIGASELHSVAIKFAADLVRMGLENNCPGQREHIDREEVVERTMRFKHDIDAILAKRAATGGGT